MKTDKLYHKQLKALLITWVIICSLLALQFIITEIFQPETYDLDNMLSIPLIRIVVGSILIIIIILPSFNYLRGKKPLYRIIGLSVVGIVFSLLLVFFNGLVRQWVLTSVNIDQLVDEVIQRTIISLYHNITYYVMIVAILVAIDYLEEKIVAVKNRNILKEELAQAKLHVLRNQLQPHFLFNALNSISSIIDESKELAQDMIADLSYLLRTSLQTDYSKKISLERELAILNTYLNIEKRRFEHQLETEELIQIEANEIMIPPFLLQPIAENAIKHGFSDGTRILKIKTEAIIIDDQLQIKIANNGTPLNGIENGIGLQNIKDRLKSAFGDQFQFCIKQENDWVVNELKLSL